MGASRSDDRNDEITAALRRQLADRVDWQQVPAGIDPERLAAGATEWIMSAITADTGTSLLARRIGPVYTTRDLARWLVMPGRDPLTPQAIRKRAKLRQLVGFLTDDNQWAFPTWQFDRAASRLIPKHEVVTLWQRLPHDGVLSDVDLAAWMNTRLSSLEDGTPADRADRRGADDSELAAAVSRLRARAA